MLRVVVAVITFALAGCGQFERIKGSGTIKTETRLVQGFTAVDLSGTGDVVIEQTGTESLTISTDASAPADRDRGQRRHAGDRLRSQ